MKNTVLLLFVVATSVSTTGCGSCKSFFAKKPVAQPVASVCAPVCAPACQPACVPACDSCQSGGFSSGYGMPYDSATGEPVVVPSNTMPGPIGSGVR
ncbi:MAG: hypothetical protein AAGA92_04570 [Planctomycetota bacterium]